MVSNETEYQSNLKKIDDMLRLTKNQNQIQALQALKGELNSMK